MFTLLEFKVFNKDKTLYDCQFAQSEHGKRKTALTTLVIGENGTGKSYLLAIIADIFRFLHNIDDSNAKQKLYYDRYCIKYLINSKEIEIEVDKKKGVLLNGVWMNPSSAEAQDTILKLELPAKIMTMAFMINDKFSFTKESNKPYEYIGIRHTSNSSFTSSIQKQICKALTTIFQDHQRLTKLFKILSFLNLKQELSVVYSLKRKTLFNRTLTSDAVRHKIITKQTTSRYLSGKRAEELLNQIPNILKFVASKKMSVDQRKPTYEFSITPSSDSKWLEEHKYMSLLEEIGFVSAPDLHLFKKDSAFEFEYASSGEKHFIFTMINLVATVQQNSLILIDEPDLSMHPTWQMRYIHFLKQVLLDFHGCHCILATHSHFMVSDLEPTSSSLVALTMKNGDNNTFERQAEYINHSTYAWSAENILYKVFNLRTTRNWYFESDVYELLSLISTNSKDFDKLNTLLQRLKPLVFDDKDPLKEITSKAESYIKEL